MQQIPSTRLRKWISRETRPEQGGHRQGAVAEVKEGAPRSPC